MHNNYFIEGTASFHLIDHLLEETIASQKWKAVHLVNISTHVWTKTNQLKVMSRLPIHKDDVICDYHGIHSHYDTAVAMNQLVGAPKHTISQMVRYLDLRCVDNNDSMEHCVSSCHGCFCHTDQQYDTFLGKYISHAISPNARARPIMVGSTKAMIVTAVADIPIDTEISIDYSHCPTLCRPSWNGKVPMRGDDVLHYSGMRIYYRNRLL